MDVFFLGLTAPYTHVQQPTCCIHPSPNYAFNGRCETCAEPIWGDCFEIKRGARRGEYCIDCAIDNNFICATCLKDECECEVAA
jgi:hypothetical protein